VNGSRVSELAQKSLVVCVAREDGSPVVATLDDVRAHSGDEEPSSGHAAVLANVGAIENARNLRISSFGIAESSTARRREEIKFRRGV
jgi:hypothetical protein